MILFLWKWWKVIDLFLFQLLFLWLNYNFPFTHLRRNLRMILVSLAYPTLDHLLDDILNALFGLPQEEERLIVPVDIEKVGWFPQKDMDGDLAFNWSVTFPNDTQSWLSLLISWTPFKADKSHLWLSLVCAVLWKIWEERNSRIFWDKSRTAKDILILSFMMLFLVRRFTGFTQSQLFFPHCKLETPFIFPLNGFFLYTL